MKPLRLLLSVLSLAILLISVMIGLPVAVAQHQFNASDSLCFGAASNDTSMLRTIVNEHQGERVAAMARNRIGFLAFKARNLSLAQSEFQIVRNESGDLPEAKESLYFLGRIAWQQQDYPTAKSMFRKYLDSAKGSYWEEGSHYYLIKAMAQLNDSLALSEMRRFLVERPQAFYAKDVQYHIINHFRSKGDFPNAITEAKTMLEKYPTSTYANDLRNQIGDYYFKLGRFQDAVDYYRALRDSARSNTEPAAIAQFLLGELYDRRGEYELARKEYGAVVSNHGAISNWEILAEYAIAQTFYKQAVQCLDSALCAHALQSLANFVSTHPTDKRTPRASMTMASLQCKMSRPTDALESYNRVIVFDESRMTNINIELASQELAAHRQLVVQARLSRALLLRDELNRPEDSMAEYERILQSDGTRREALLGKAIVLMNLGRAAEARPILESLANDRELGNVANEYLRQL